MKVRSNLARSSVGSAVSCRNICFVEMMRYTATSTALSSFSLDHYSLFYISFNPPGHHQAITCYVGCVDPPSGICIYTSIVAPGCLASCNLPVGRFPAVQIDSKSGGGFGIPEYSLIFCRLVKWGYWCCRKLNFWWDELKSKSKKGFDFIGNMV